ncbi:MAG: hypothetical protein GF329_16075 [Candidatus Lokiarchaeota archaeon]|nr:hypothetical protein [Candidatus Lokiarchaeota archaeon]
MDKDWKALFEAVKDWEQYPAKYQDMPRVPRDKKKSGAFLAPIFLSGFLESNST